MSMDELTDFVVQVETNAGLNLHTGMKGTSRWSAER